MQPIPILLIGAQKSGSSYLYRLIAQDNAVSVAHLAEPKIFSKPRFMSSNFFSHFQVSKHHKFVLDGSTSYLHVNGTAERVAKTLGTEIPILVSLRDPNERTISGYCHEVKHGRELRAPWEVFTFGPGLSSAISEENEKIDEAWKNGLIQPHNPVYDRYYDPFFGFRYVANSSYLQQLAPWFSLFSNIRLVDFEHLRTKPLQVITAVRAWLGLPTVREVSVNHSRNSTVLRRWPAIRENRGLEYDYLRPSLFEVWQKQQVIFRSIRNEKPKLPLEISQALWENFESLKSKFPGSWLSC